MTKGLLISLTLLILFLVPAVLDGQNKSAPALRPHSIARFLAQPVKDSIRDQPTLGLTALQAVTIVADGATSRLGAELGGVERDPLAKLFLGSKATWSRMVPIGSVQVLTETWLAGKMGESHNRAIRELRFLPVALGAIGNGVGFAINTASLSRSRYSR